MDGAAHFHMRMEGAGCLSKDMWYRNIDPWRFSCEVSATRLVIALQTVSFLMAFLCSRYVYAPTVSGSLLAS